MATDPVYILGLGTTAVGRQPERGFTDLAREAVANAFADAGPMDPTRIDQLWFSNYMMDFWGQRACRGQEVLTPLIEEGLLPPALPILNVEAGCASASVAFHEAWKHVLAGQSDLALAVGAEKMNDPTRPAAQALEWIGAAAGTVDPDAYWQPYRDLAADLGTTFAVAPGGSFAMDCYALWAQDHMHTYGTTIEQIAASAAKNHTNAVDNPRAQYRFPMTVDQVLADRVVSAPLTRAMCAPTGDAAAAVVLCSRHYLDQVPAEIRERAIRVRGHGLGGGHRGVRLTSGDPRRAPVQAARKAYAMAGLGPNDIDLVELHDATSFAEIHLVEDLGFCEPGKGGVFTASGESARDGRIPVNPSGGLVSRGHPIGATGMFMLHEAALQLRGEAEVIQIPNARVALVENGGGIVGHDVAVCSVTVLEGGCR